jgi:hypothetical protein
MTVTTAHVGTNADLIAAVAELYLADGAVVADVTYGKGAFWRKVDTSRFDLRASDIQPQNGKVAKLDFRALSYEDASVDIVVLDPPYVHNPGRHQTDARYNNAATASGMYNADIIADFYGGGLAEAWRVLREGGQSWVKCKDEVEAGIQRWSHIAIYDLAINIGFAARDLFVIVPSSETSSKRWSRQIHARKRHSYLWVFERPDEEYRRLLARKTPQRRPA